MKKSKGVNYHSGEKVDDLVKQVKDADHTKVEGETQTDSSYEKEMYSEEQMERQKTMDNIFKVDNVPSRWEHNKLRSTWHFDPFANPREQTFIVTNRFVGDFDEAIEYAVNRGKEQTIGNYRNRNESKQDADLHDGEIQDVINASGKDDVSSMYHDSIVKKKFDKDGNITARENRIPQYEVLFRMIDTLGVDVHQARLHIQKLGQVTPVHIDQQMRYARPGWRKVWLDGGGDTNPLKLRRFLVMLQDWDYGHVWQFGNTYYQGYKAGECITYDWCNMPHGTANFGFTPRVTFQFTGFISDKTQEFIDNPDPERIIEV
tara:strand:+ start:4748 stop:5698 length:951 start_codon:yes stop_codon:yes gene_type:complete